MCAKDKATLEHCPAHQPGGSLLSPVCFSECALHLLVMGTSLATPRQSPQAGPCAPMFKHPSPSEAAGAPVTLKPPDTLRKGTEDAQSSSSGGRGSSVQSGPRVLSGLLSSPTWDSGPSSGQVPVIIERRARQGCLSTGLSLQHSSALVAPKFSQLCVPPGKA